MAFRRVNPYEDLIQSFLANTQATTAALGQRFEGQRQERLIGEERDFLQGERVAGQEFTSGLQEDQQAFSSGESALQRDFLTGERLGSQDFTTRRDATATDVARTDEALRREQALTDAAARERLRLASEIGNGLVFLTPGTPEFEEAKRVMESLTMPSLAVGDAAWQEYMNLSGTAIATQSLLARTKREVETSENWRDTTLQGVFTYLSDPLIGVEQKTDYYNTVVANSDFFTEDMRLSLAPLMKITDPAGIEAIRLGNQLTGVTIDATAAGIANTEVQTARARVGLKLDEKLAPLTYEEAVLALEDTRLEYKRTVRQDFLEYGAVPQDTDRAMALAREMGIAKEGMTQEQVLDALEQFGRSRWERVQRLERINEDLLTGQSQLVGKQVDLAEVTRIQAQLAYDRDAVFGEIQAKTNLAEIAFAAASAGDVQTLQMMESLSTTAEYSEAMGGIVFSELIARANEALGDETAQREYEAANRALTLGNDTLIYETNLNTFVSAIGAQFRFSDYENGGLEADIQTYLDGMTPAQFTRLGLDRDGMAKRLRAEAMFQRATRGQSGAAAAMNTMSASIPSGEEQQIQWRTTFMTLADQLEMDPDAAEAIANGLLSGANLDFWEARLERENLEADTALKIAQAGEMMAEGVGGLSSELYGDILSGLEANRDRLETMFNSAYCTVEQAGGGRTISTENLDECTTIQRDLEGVGAQIDTLVAARSSNSPWVYSAFVGDTIDNSPTALEAVGNETVYGWLTEGQVNGGELTWVRQYMPEIYNELMVAVRDEVIRDPDTLSRALADAANAFRMEDAVALNTDGSPRADTVPLSQVNVNSGDFRSGTPRERAERLAGVTEWDRLIRSIVSGTREMPTDLEFEDLAKQFGFNVPFGFARVPGSRGDSRNVGDLKQALNEGLRYQRELDEIAPQRATEKEEAWQEYMRVTRENMPTGTEGGTAAITTDSPLFNALIQQESGGNHRRPDGSLTVNARSGAMGVTQVMPLTAWQPGFGVKPLVTLSAEQANQVRTLMGTEQTRRTEAREAEGAGDIVTRDRKLAEATQASAGIREIITTVAESVPPEEFVRFGQDYLNAMLARYDGDTRRALAAYNAGPGVVDRAVARDPENWLTLMPDETQGYVTNILRMAEQANAQASLPRGE